MKKKEAYCPESRAVIGLCLDVHTALGPGLLESAYEECVAAELVARGFRFERQPQIDVTYRGRAVKAFFADFIVFDRIVLELKSVWKVHDLHETQLRTYARIAKKPVGLLINFNVQRLRDGGIKRIEVEEWKGPIDSR